MIGGMAESTLEFSREPDHPVRMKDAFEKAMYTWFSR
jgi:hypothetical protein